MNAAFDKIEADPVEFPTSLWVLDESFLTAALAAAQNASVVSLDIFDTALTRPFDSPIDAFAEMERRLAGKYGPLAKGFAAARETAERAARHRHYKERGAEEISIRDVYTELPNLLPKFEKWAEALNIELDVERESLTAVPDILELARRLGDQGTPFIFVSDMYLPAAFLDEVLSKSGYSGWESIFVSSEVQLTKASGRIWDVIAQRYPKGILHIGDDARSDVLVPQSHGVATLEYTRARSERRVGAQLTPAILPFSKSKRILDLASRASSGLSPESEQWEILGGTMGALVVGTFISWLAERATLHHIDRLYFCARDGWLIKKAWDAADFSTKTGIEAKYLGVSRRPLNLASGYKDSTPFRIDGALLSFLSGTDGKITVGEALDRAGLLDDRDLAADAGKSFGSLGAMLLWPDGSTKFEQLLQRHASAVYRLLSPAHDSLMGYLRQEGLIGAGKSAIVDMGWHGTMQRSLGALIRPEGFSVAGFYYGLWPPALGGRYTAGMMESAFASDFLSNGEQPEIYSAVAILEELHAAPHGTVTGYELADAIWRPTYADNPAERQQFDTKIKHFQAGVIRAVSDIFHGRAHACLTLDDLTVKAAVAAVGAVALSPNQRELEMLSSLGHCASYDHLHLTSFASTQMPENDEQLQQAFWQAHWRFGLLRNWSIGASDSARQRVRDLAAQHLSDLGERILGQL